MNIILCGFMGCGKTTAGKALAARLGRTFVDTDERIAARQGIAIRSIFETRGEAYFRDLEYAACQALGKQDQLVISTGGGALTFPRNVAALQQNGKILLLDVPFAQLAERVGGDPNRPLFRDVEKAHLLYEERRPLYRAAADHIIDGTLPVSQIVEQICTLLAIGKYEDFSSIQ